MPTILFSLSRQKMQLINVIKFQKVSYVMQSIAVTSTSTAKTKY